MCPWSFRNFLLWQVEKHNHDWARERQILKIIWMLHWWTEQPDWLVVVAKTTDSQSSGSFSQLNVFYEAETEAGTSVALPRRKWAPFESEPKVKRAATRSWRKLKPDASETGKDDHSFDSKFWTELEKSNERCFAEEEARDWRCV